MTPAEAFKDGGFNPTMGLWARDWYAVGSNFSPPHLHLQYEGKILKCVRMLSAIDAASRYFLNVLPVPTKLNTTQARDVIVLLEQVFAKHGPPRKGVVITNSVWYSSLELLGDEGTAPRGEDLAQIEATFGPMGSDAKKAISDWVGQQGIRCVFNADEIG